ncbi:CLUMA_CG017389, isoform A [Clunio marinus]|uniref:CLUMA_CG017389, isoform A n=1 Tax=Clunio marinus TaxID=568069 RepID=A0A1J1IVJ7_9DIPT|nr:CLUMA_CG017389, isoform A [Clunio marinus]
MKIRVDLKFKRISYLRSLECLHQQPKKNYNFIPQQSFLSSRNLELRRGRDFIYFIFYERLGNRKETEKMLQARKTREFYHKQFHSSSQKIFFECLTFSTVKTNF